MDTAQHKKFKVLLVGDSCTDVYQFGSSERISPEAPVPVFVPKYKQTKPGMAANVQENLTQLGVDCVFFTSEKSVKTRLIDVKTNQQFIRIDQDYIAKNPIKVSDVMDLLDVDAVVVSDYDKGFITYEFVEQVRQLYAGPIFVDTKKPDLQRFRDCFVKINEPEYARATSTNNRLIVTLGSRGASYNGIFYATTTVHVQDVCGAGDTFLAALVYAYLNTQSIPESIQFANLAAAVTVQHVGVYAPRLEEIYDN